MSSNPNNKGKGGGQGPRKRGFIFGAILWALVLVIFFNFLAKQIANAGTKEVPYSEFIQMVEEDKVATVELTSNKYTFYLKEDLPAGAGEGGSQDLAEVLAQQMEQIFHQADAQAAAQLTPQELRQLTAMLKTVCASLAPTGKGEV